MSVVPHFSLESLPPHSATRVKALLQRLGATPNPQIAVRAPGRVNLIGEHTDYNGYPVMPIAMEREIRAVASATGGHTIEISNSDPRFSPRRIDLTRPLTSFAAGDWGNYFLAALNELEPDLEPRGFTAIFDGDLPEAAGLSSSSALVVASALVLIGMSGVAIDPLHLAERLARAEHFVGTAGGGMDQAISLMGKAGRALRIDFFPLRTRALALPPDVRVVICHSCVRAPKSEAAMQEYNRRPIECRLAAALIAAELRRRCAFPAAVERLADVDRSRIPLPAAEIDRIIDSALTPAAQTLAQLAQKLGRSEASLLETELSPSPRFRLQPPADGFQVQRRYRHVVGEAERVEKATRALESGDAAALGRLMDASHASCRDDYGISTPELDELVALGREAGSLGSRLTGAGFGGCTVHLVPAEQVKVFKERVWRSYYRTYLPGRRPDLATGDDPDKVMFETGAAAGAGFIDLIE